MMFFSETSTFFHSFPPLWNLALRSSYDRSNHRLLHDHTIVAPHCFVESLSTSKQHHIQRLQPIRHVILNCGPFFFTLSLNGLTPDLAHRYRTCACAWPFRPVFDTTRPSPPPDLRILGIPAEPVHASLRESNILFETALSIPASVVSSSLDRPPLRVLDLQICGPDAVEAIWSRSGFSKDGRVSEQRGREAKPHTNLGN